MCGKVLMFLEGIQKVSFFPYAFQLFHSFYVPTWQLSESTEPEFGNEVVHVYAEKRKSQRWWHKRSIWCFSDRALDYRLVSNYQLNAQFLYSITIYMLYDNPRHVSSSTMHIFRRTNCIITANGIVTLHKQPYSMPVESGLQSTLNRHTVRPFTESDHTRCCNNTICPPEDEHGAARNMLRIIM